MAIREFEELLEDLIKVQRNITNFCNKQDCTTDNFTSEYLLLFQKRESILDKLKADQEELQNKINELETKIQDQDNAIYDLNESILDLTTN